MFKVPIYDMISYIRKGVKIFKGHMQVSNKEQLTFLYNLEIGNMINFNVFSKT